MFHQCSLNVVNIQLKKSSHASYILKSIPIKPYRLRYYHRSGLSLKNPTPGSGFPSDNSSERPLDLNSIFNLNHGNDPHLKDDSSDAFDSFFNSLTKKSPNPKSKGSDKRQKNANDLDSLLASLRDSSSSRSSTSLNSRFSANPTLPPSTEADRLFNEIFDADRRNLPPNPISHIKKGPRISPFDPSSFQELSQSAEKKYGEEDRLDESIDKYIGESINALRDEEEHIRGNLESTEQQEDQINLSKLMEMKQERYTYDWMQKELKEYPLLLEDDDLSSLPNTKKKNFVSDYPSESLDNDEVDPSEASDELDDVFQPHEKSSDPNKRVVLNPEYVDDILEQNEALRPKIHREIAHLLSEDSSPEAFPIWLSVRKKQPDGTYITENVLSQSKVRGPMPPTQSQMNSTDSVTSQDTPSIFSDLMQQEKGINEMEFWNLFPEQIKRWLIYTKTPKGYYNNHGEWKPYVPPRPRYISDMDRVISDVNKDDDYENMDKDPEWLEEESNVGNLDPTSSEHFQDHGRYQSDLVDDQSYTNLKNNDDINVSYQREQQQLPADLRGQYRFFIQPSEMENLDIRIRRIFSFSHASKREITAFRKKKIIEKWGKHIADTGNDAVQISALTLRIHNLNLALKNRPSDKSNMLRLQRLIRRRKALMKHLKANDLLTYYTLIKEIKLRDQVELYTP